MGNILRAATLVIFAYWVTTGLEINGHRTILISTAGEDSSKCLVNSSYPCQHISYVMENTNTTNTTIILENGVHFLNSTIRLQYVDNLYLTGQNISAKPVINCGKNDSALFFTKSSNINVKHIIIQNCGGTFRSTSEVNGKFENLTTAFHITESENVSLMDVEIRHSHGMGAVFYDVTGVVIFERVYFISNTGRYSERSRGCSSGGGIYVEFRYLQSKNNHRSSGNYTFRYCRFLNNEAEYQYGFISESIRTQFISIGRGGGISFISRGKHQGNHLTVTSCVFERNKALWGAGIFVELNDETGSNEIRIDNSIFSQNRATMAGGGVRIGINSNSAMGYNIVNIKKTNFTQNIARIGGAFSQYRPTIDRREEERINMVNCTFTNNTAFIGTSLHVQYVNIHLEDCAIVKNTISEYLQEYPSEDRGALYCYKSNISLHGESRIERNNFTAFFLDACLVIVHNVTVFAHNSGTLGGAIAVYSHSTIRMTSGSRLYFHNNFAKEKGGAIYVETPIFTFINSNSTELNIYRCFFEFGDKDGEYLHPEDVDTLIDFQDNHAFFSCNGDAIWATTLNWCRDYSYEVFNKTIFQSKSINFHGNSSLTSIITSPNTIRTKEEDWNTHPGFTKEIGIHLLDENNNFVEGTVQIDIKSNGQAVMIRNSRVTVDEQGKVPITMIGPEQADFTVSLKTESRIPVMKYIFNRTLKRCPPGFHLYGKICKCYTLEEGVAYCNEENGSINILYGRWGNPNGGKSFAKHVCPPHYCNFKNRSREKGYAYWEGMQQCAEGRDKNSPLCSKCEKNKSVVFGAEKCQPCGKKKDGLWLLLLLVFLTVFVLLVMLVNLDSYSTYLNAFLFSYQIIPMIIEDSSLDTVISLVISFSQLSGTGKIQKGVCIGFQVDNMTKIFLNYMIPVYLIICTATIGTISYYLKKSPFNSRTVFRAFVFISFVAYCDFTKITFQLLEPTFVDSHLVLYHAAHIPYFGKQHAPFAACALFILIFIVIGFPLALIFSYAITASSKFVKLKAIFDTFKDPFVAKEYYDIFSCFYFISRFVLLILDCFVQRRTMRDTSLALASVLIAAFFIYFKPYKSTGMNRHDSLLLINIAVISVLKTGYDMAYVPLERTGFDGTIHVLTYIPLLCLLLRLIAWIIKKISSFCAARQKSKARAKKSKCSRIPYRVHEFDDSYMQYQEDE